MIHHTTPPEKGKDDLIDDLLSNDISLADLVWLRDQVSAEDLALIIQRIYDLNERDILGLAAVTGPLKTLDDAKNTRRNKRFTKKITSGFRKVAENKIVLVEGDSWFNYPIILTDVIDTLGMDPRIAIYSLAKGGGWLLSMLTARKYVEELSVLHPDIFIISGGGNDIVGERRLGAIVQPTPDGQLGRNPWAKLLLANANTKDLAFNHDAFNAGAPYLSKDFFALLMFFHLQYYFLMKGILDGGKEGVSKFPNITILTQGYDYPIPSLDKGFGPDPAKWYVPVIRSFLGHGSWLKIPLEIRGITDCHQQRHIVYAMIFLFNEMMIYTGGLFNNFRKRVLHIDSRNSLGEHGWTDELHAKPCHFIRTGRVMDFAIFDPGHANSTYEHVYVVNKILPS